MGREIPFNEEAICDICGGSGAYDLMGDYICQSCLHLEVKRNNGGDDELS